MQTILQLVVSLGDIISVTCVKQILDFLKCVFLCSIVAVVMGIHLDHI